jgi:hypothetical protein
MNLLRLRAPVVLGMALCSACSHERQAPTDEPIARASDALATGSWVQDNPAGLPKARQGAAHAYDSKNHLLLLFGGQGGGELSDFWSWDGLVWTQLMPDGGTGPSARKQVPATFDANRGKMVIFGGENGNTYLGDTWEWDGAAWAQLTPTVSPSPRWMPVVYTEGPIPGTLGFGGEDGSAVTSSETWRWKPLAPGGATWEQITTLGAPPARTGHAMAFDASRHTVVMFGGATDKTGTTYLNDTWELDISNWPNATWKEACVGTCKTGAPPARSEHRLAYDEARKRIVLFGGYQGSSNLNDTWEWDGIGWVDQSQTSGPSPRRNPAIAYDSLRKKIYLFGGAGPFINNNETWEYTAYGSDCTTLDACDGAYACKSGVCCTTACAETCQVCSKTLGATTDGICATAPAGYSGYLAGCGNLLCDGTGVKCPANCLSDAMCAAGFYCSGKGNCLPRKGQGSACNFAADCLSGSCRVCSTTGGCVDGFCCDTVCDGACDACSKAAGAQADGTCGPAAAGTEASACGLYACDGASSGCPTTCTSQAQCASGAQCNTATSVCEAALTEGSACTSPASCKSGFCVDGVCCGTACTGQCQACDETPGKCVIITGKPHGSRQACEGQGTTCGATCGGKAQDACAFPGKATACAPASCQLDKRITTTCDGKGACVENPAQVCAPYRCDPTGCLTTCASSNDCTTGNACGADHTCSPEVAGTCDGAHTLKGGPAGDQDCTPYACNVTACRTLCDTSADCAAGYVCDSQQGQGKCVAASAPAAESDSGGCGCRVPGTRGRGAEGWLVLLLGSLGLRRRRTRAGT